MNINDLNKTNFIEYAGQWNDKNIYDKIKKLIDGLQGSDIRREKMKIGRNLIDGYGSVRIVNYLLGLKTGMSL